MADTVSKMKLPLHTNILELGCGTGLFGEAVSKKGYTNLDGLDGSEEMLKRAEAKGMYNHLGV